MNNLTITFQFDNIKVTGQKVYCYLHGEFEEYFIESPHPDANGKGLYADMVTRCANIIATFTYGTKDIKTTE